MGGTTLKPVGSRGRSRDGGEEETATREEAPRTVSASSVFSFAAFSADAAEAETGATASPRRREAEEEGAGMRRRAFLSHPGSRLAPDATVTVGAVEASAGGIVRVRVGAGRARDREAPGLLSPRNRGVSGPPRNDERHGECD